MVDDDQLETSKAIQRRTGKTFHVATRLLPAEIRHPTYVLYAFFRVADDVVDDPDPGSPAEQRRELDRIRRAALGEVETDDPVLSAFREVKVEYDIPDREVNEFVAAMESDVDADDYRTYGDLEEYLRGSAVAVGYMMLALMDPEEYDRARPHARALGEAFQLTNFLRDVREDVVEYGRVYLPEETLREHGVEREQVLDLEFSSGFADAVRAELHRTERLYREGVAGIEYLPEDCQFAVLLSAVLYADHHRLIREVDYDVLSTTPSLSTRRRLSLAARTWFHWKRERDPVAVFYRVSDLAPEPETDPSVPTPPDLEVGQSRFRA